MNADVRSAPRAGRGAVRRALSAWNLTPLMNDPELLVSELTAHAAGCTGGTATDFPSSTHTESDGRSFTLGDEVATVAQITCLGRSECRSVSAARVFSLQDGDS